MLDTRALSSLTPGRPKLGARIAARLWRCWTVYSTWRARKATVEILQALDNRTLKDIGLGRSELGSVVFGKPNDRSTRYREDWPWRLY